MTTGTMTNVTEESPQEVFVNTERNFTYGHWGGGTLIRRRNFVEVRRFPTNTKDDNGKNYEELLGKYIKEDEYNMLNCIKELNTRNVIKHLYLYKNHESNIYYPPYHVIYKHHKMDLFEAITSPENKLPKGINKCIKDLFCGVNALHQKYIAHRDIKPENVVIDEFGNLMLIDFGLSKIYGKDNYEDNVTCGTLMYSPPEYNTSDKWNVFSADIWMLGITIYTMVFKAFPETTHYGKRLKYPVEIPTKKYDGSEVDRNLVYIMENTACMTPGSTWTRASP